MLQTGFYVPRGPQLLAVASRSGSVASTSGRLPRSVRVSARASEDEEAQRQSARSKGKMSKNKRRGRPAYLRTPYDTPLRDGNRDRLIGYLTERAAKTLLCYLMETNLNLYHWLTAYMRETPIPKNGNWDDVSGDTFLRQLLNMPIQSAKYELKRDHLYDNMNTTGVDPRSIAQRIMEIRSQLAVEFIQDLSQVREENATLYRETLTASLNSMMTTACDTTSIHPEMRELPDDDKPSPPGTTGSRNLKGR